MIVGTAGHIDHGKTSLVKMLTGVDTDRLKEEKARGISIELGFAYLSAPYGGGIIGFIDVPGHEKFVHTMLAGASGIDYVILVVAADDGVMPQTLEHLSIINLLGVKRGIVALTKADLAAPPWRAQVSNDIRRVLAGTALAEAEVVAVSSTTGEGIAELRQHLFDVARTLPTRPVEGRFRLAVDRSFTLAGAGTVVTGTVLSGVVSVGDRVMISPSGLSARVRSIHAQNQPAERGIAGQRCALNLAGDGISKDAIARGDVVLDADLHAPAIRIDAMLHVVTSELKPVTQWMPVRLHHAAAEVSARIVLLTDESIRPGQEGRVQLVLDRPIAAAGGDRFVLRDTTAQRTLGGGQFLDLRAPARKRRTPERMAQLDAHALADPAEAVAALLRPPPGYVDLAGFCRDRALSVQQAEDLVTSLGLVRIQAGDATLAVSAQGWTRLHDGVLAALKAFHTENPDLPGMGLERLRMQSEPRLPAPAFVAALQVLVRAGEISLDGAWVRLAGHEVRLMPQDEELWTSIQPMLGGAERFRPPRVRDVANSLAVPEAEIRRLMKTLARMGQVDEVAHDHFFPRDTVAEMVGIAIAIAAQTDDGQFTAAQLRDRLDNGRKVAIQILEFFDRHGVTLRRGDLRRLNRHRLDLFRRQTETDTLPAGKPSGRDSSPVGRPGFKPGWGREPVPGGFDSHSLPPFTRDLR